MGWSGGTFSRTNGTHTGTTVWQQDEAALVNIEADLHDTHDQDLADGINACVAKDGSNAMTGDLDLGNNDLKNVTTINSAGPGVSIGAQSGTGNVTLYRNGTAVLTGTANGVQVGAGANVSPTGVGVGQLTIAGSSYTGFIAMDGTAMYIGHNSGSRDLVLQTDETSRFTLGSGGSMGFFGGAGTTKPTITGAKGGNTALANLLTALASLGLITDSTT